MGGRQPVSAAFDVSLDPRILLFISGHSRLANHVELIAPVLLLLHLSTVSVLFLFFDSALSIAGWVQGSYYQVCTRLRSNSAWADL